MRGSYDSTMHWRLRLVIFLTGLTSRGPAGTQVNTPYSYALTETVIEAVGPGWESECILLII